MRFLLLAALCVGCVTPAPYRPFHAAVAIDFRDATSDGFLLTPDAYTGPHQPLGMVFVTAQAGASLQRRDGYLRWVSTPLTVGDAILEAKEYAKKLGGDGIANLEVRYSSRRLPPTGSSYQAVEAPGWEIRGLAIKRNP